MLLFRSARGWQGLGHYFLDAVAADRFTHIDGTFRVDRHHVQETEQAWVVSEPTEAGDGRSARHCGGFIEGPQHLVLAVRDEGPCLRRIAREIDVPCGAAAFLAGANLSRNDVDVADEGTVSPVDVDLVLPPAAAVYQLLAADPAATRRAAATDGDLIVARADAAELAQIISPGVEHDHAMIAIPIGDIDAARLTRDRVGVRVDRNGCRQIEILMAEACPGDIASTRPSARNRRVGVRGHVSAGAAVALELLPDLQQHRAAIMRVFLDDAVAVAADPNVVLIIDITAMHAVRQH